MPHRSARKLPEASQQIGINKQRLLELVEQEWLKLEDRESFDDEDIARARLIIELRDEFGVNDESIPIILHLLDQLYSLRAVLVRKL